MLSGGRPLLTLLLCLISLACGGEQEQPNPPQETPVSLDNLWVTTIDTVRSGDTFNTVLLRIRNQHGARYVVLKKDYREDN